MFLQNSDGSDGILISNDHIKVETSGLERLRINGSGNVGIGTTSPIDLLHINSNTHDARMILDSAAGFDGELKFFENGSAKYTIGYDAGTSNFVIGTINVDTSQRLAITSAGNVGIGTTGPTSKLHVQGTSFFFDQAIFDDKVGIGTTSPSYKLHVNGGDAQIANGIAGTLYMNNSNNYLYGDTNGVGVLAAGDNLRIKTNNFTRLRVIQNGNVGIGTTSPSHKLSVNGTVSSDLFRGYTYPDNSFLDFDKDDTAAANYTGLASIGRIAYLADTNANEPTANAAHEFFTGTSDIDTATSLMIIETSGNVGIGTTSPSEKLHVSGNARITGAIYDSNNDPGTSGQVLSSTAT
jgi:hypothetical protein